jgi:hypothetical protein
METLQIEKSSAVEAFQQADEKGKQLLKKLFGDQISTKITDRVKTFEDACIVLEIDPADVLHSAHSDFLKPHIDSVNAYCKIIVISKALNEGWIPDWNDEDQYKYYPWFYFHSPSGFRLNGVYYHYSYSGVGSRLCFKSRELAEYAATQFQNIYEQFFTI